MKVLVIGSGGREHALVWKIAQSKKVDEVYCAPGNGGISQIAQCVDIPVDNIDKLVEFAKENNIDLTVVGPELPLVLGIVDRFNKEGIRVFGPNKECAQFEGSKAFTKEFLEKYSIPTAKYKEYVNLHNALEEVDDFGYPVVVKADGLAAGKGVIIAENRQEAQRALKEMMEDNVFGKAGEKVILEEFLTGIEASILCFVDGETIVPMESAQDYKRIYDGDAGLNTGGMGTYSPNKIFNEDLDNIIQEQILEPIIKGFKNEKYNFKGVLFIGLMIKENKPKVLEFNVRFGDPETQSVLMRLETDIVEVFENVIDGKLASQNLTWNNKKSICIVLASGGYPESYEKGKLITGLDTIENCEVFHAGTKLDHGKLYTSGGRVLGITTIAETLEKARKVVYGEINKINFEGMQYRKDIAE